MATLAADYNILLDITWLLPLPYNRAAYDVMALPAENFLLGEPLLAIDTIPLQLLFIFILLGCYVFDS